MTSYREICNRENNTVDMFLDEDLDLHTVGEECSCKPSVSYPTFDPGNPTVYFRKRNKQMNLFPFEALLTQYSSINELKFN